MGRITEVCLDSLGKLQVRIACPSGAIPGAGQYLRAWVPGDEQQALPLCLFPAEMQENGFLAAPPAPANWLPGMRLQLYGPLGAGFHIAPGVRRLALAAFGETPSRLLPLIPIALAQQADVTLFSELNPALLPPSVEVSSLNDLPEAIRWADFLALDITPQILPTLRQRLGLKANEPLSLKAQALVNAVMPCAGVAECGVCAIPARRGWKLACLDGPVFDLADLEW